MRYNLIFVGSNQESVFDVLYRNGTFGPYVRSIEPTVGKTERWGLETGTIVACDGGAGAIARTLVTELGEDSVLLVSDRFLLDGDDEPYRATITVVDESAPNYTKVGPIYLGISRDSDGDRYAYDVTADGVRPADYLN